MINPRLKCGIMVGG